MNKDAIKKNIAGFLREKKEITFAYLFGSFVQKDNFHDIDIALYLARDFNKNDLEKFPYGYESRLISEINLLVREKIDLIVMNNAEILIQQRIINKGYLLFSRDERVRISYENFIRKLYIDTESLRSIKKHYLSLRINNARY